MTLKTQTDYALRTLLYLAFVGEKVTVDAIARAYGISKDHLVKVVQQLARLGYVRSQSGRTGGVRLSKLPEQINVADVVADFEGRSGVLACVAEPQVCVLEPGCLLRTMLMQAEAAFYGILRKATIADLVRVPPGGAAEATKLGGMYNLTVRPPRDRVSPPP